MPSTEGYTGPTDLVYNVGDGDNVVFADRDTALCVAHLYDALNSKTWAEFRVKLPEGGWSFGARTQVERVALRTEKRAFEPCTAARRTMGSTAAAPIWMIAAGVGLVLGDVDSSGLLITVWVNKFDHATPYTPGQYVGSSCSNVTPALHLLYFAVLPLSRTDRTGH
jgi:hypothetical protein